MLRSCEASKRTAVAVMVSVHLVDGVEKSRAAEAAERLRSFRGELYGCLGQRADELFELTDALLCAEGSVRSLVGLCLAPEHRRGHGALYDALNHGSVHADRLRTRLAQLPVPAMFGGRDRAGRRRHAVAASGRADLPRAAVLPRLWRGRHRQADQQIPGWPYQLVVALESGPTSWTAVLDVVRLGPADDATAVTAGQLRSVIGRLRAAGHWQPGDPPIMVVLDSGYDVCRLAFVLAGLPVQLIGRLRADRVLLGPASPRPLASPSRSGYGRRTPAPTPPRFSAAGRPTCAASTKSTPSGCSSRSWAGPPRRSAPRPRPTAGPG
jgi:hypothetical protein